MYFLIGASLLFTFLIISSVLLAVITAASWRLLDPICDTVTPKTGAGLLFVLRIMPIAVSLVFILAFILPAFLLYEPSESGETIGLKLMLMIGFAAIGIAAAIFRVLGSWWRTHRLVAEWSKNTVPIELDSFSIPIFKLRHSFPVFAVVGILRPKIYIAERVLDSLDSSEIAAVLKHELGHIAARDNLKNLAMKICGDILVLPIGRSLERKWSEAAERAADHNAVENGDRETALDLASALIKIARMVPVEPLPPMPAVSYAFSLDESLSIRIRRLLRLADQNGIPGVPSNHHLAPYFALLTAAALLIGFNTSLLVTVHNISETVLGVLQ